MALVPFLEIGSRHQLEKVRDGEVVARDFFLGLMGFDHVRVDSVGDRRKALVRYL